MFCSAKLLKDLILCIFYLAPGPKPIRPRTTMPLSKVVTNIFAIPGKRKSMFLCHFVSKVLVEHFLDTFMNFGHCFYQFMVRFLLLLLVNNHRFSFWNFYRFHLYVNLFIYELNVKKNSTFSNIPPNLLF